MMETSKQALAFGLFTTIVGLVGLYADHKYDEKRQMFMIECQNDAFKHYQCEALWRGSYAILDIPAVRNGMK